MEYERKASVLIATTERVTTGNWERLRARGLVHVTNSSLEKLRSDSYSLSCSLSSDREYRHIMAVLTWELGARNVFEGDALDPRLRMPTRGFMESDYTEMVGIYAMAPAPDWTAFFMRDVSDDDPRIVEQGLRAHLTAYPTQPDDPYDRRWTVWSVYGSSDRFRCWGPASVEEGFEGTFSKVIDHIKNWEEIEGHKYGWPLWAGK